MRESAAVGVASAVVVGVVLFAAARPSTATYENARAVGRACASCHSSTHPGPNDLNETGRYFLVQRELPEPALAGLQVSAPPGARRWAAEGSRGERGVSRGADLRTSLRGLPRRGWRRHGDRDVFDQRPRTWRPGHRSRCGGPKGRAGDGDVRLREASHRERDRSRRLPCRRAQGPSTEPGLHFIAPSWGHCSKGRPMIKARHTMLATSLALGLTAAVPSSAAEALPADRGAWGTWQKLLKLQTTASALHTTAHPDDEHGGVLTWISRGLGARVALMTLNRGESGANAIGPELFDGLGLIRDRGAAGVEPLLRGRRPVLHDGSRLRLLEAARGSSRQMGEGERATRRGPGDSNEPSTRGDLPLSGERARRAWQSSDGRPGDAGGLRDGG